MRIYWGGGVKKKLPESEKNSWYETFRNVKRAEVKKWSENLLFCFVKTKLLKIALAVQKSRFLEGEGPLCMSYIPGNHVFGGSTDRQTDNIQLYILFVECTACSGSFFPAGRKNPVFWTLYTEKET